jgi:hypothetical protein
MGGLVGRLSKFLTQVTPGSSVSPALTLLRVGGHDCRQTCMTVQGPSSFVTRGRTNLVLGTSMQNLGFETYTLLSHNLTGEKPTQSGQT